MVERAGATAPTSAPARGCPFHGDVAADFRPFDLKEPFPFLERARHEQPVFHSEELGFWIVTRYLGLTVADGLRTWTVLTTVLGVAGFLLTWAVFALGG